MRDARRRRESASTGIRTVCRLGVTIVWLLLAACGSTHRAASDATQSGDLIAGDLFGGGDLVRHDGQQPDLEGPDLLGDSLGGDDSASADLSPTDLADALDNDRLPTSCAEIGSTDCFSNYDCGDSSTRCEELTSSEESPICCVKGERGVGVAGTACTLAADCQSSICIDNLCSDICGSVADCPPKMQLCMAIAFSGSDDKWCFPQ
ncbi:MAG: hypothetical protein KC609_09075 [Myxococcales bacterium]|nr:hypothetical protein [Myxococcales bacterium]